MSGADTSLREKPHRQPPWEGKSERDAVSFGAWLRRERELRQVSLREIADVTKISIRYLEALETDRFDILPAPVFAKGFLREYAKYVGLNPDEVVNSYLTAQEGDEQAEELPSPPTTRRRREWTSGLLLSLALLALLILVALLAFYAERAGDEAPAGPPAAVATPPPTPTPAEARAPVVAPAEAATQPIPTAPLVVTLDFSAECWVEALIDDRQRLNELHVQGESLRLEAQQRVVLLTLGNPEGVRLEVNGHPHPIGPFPPGRVAHDVVIDLESAGLQENAP